MADGAIFHRAGTGAAVASGPGSTRRVLLHTPELMLVEFAFEEDAVGAAHAHPHVQASYVAAGRFEVTIGNATETLSAGDSFIVPSGVRHGVRALEAGTLIDSFAPLRADFV